MSPFQSGWLPQLALSQEAGNPSQTRELLPRFRRQKRFCSLFSRVISVLELEVVKLFRQATAFHVVGIPLESMVGCLNGRGLMSSTWMLLTQHHFGKMAGTEHRHCPSIELRQRRWVWRKKLRNHTEPFPIMI